MTAVGNDDRALMLRVLRAILGCDQKLLSEVTGISQSSISRYETGDEMSMETLTRIGDAVGLPLSWMERRLLPVLRAARRRLMAAAAPCLENRPGAFRIDPDDKAALVAAVTDAIELALTQLDARVEEEFAAEQALLLAPRGDDREVAAAAWGRLAPCSAEERRFLVEQGAEFHTWALAERICDESARAVRLELDSAVDLAQLAVQVARLAPGDERWRRRLEGYTRFFLAHALSAAGERAAAKTELAAGRELWKKGALGDPTRLLAEHRLRTLEAALRQA